MVVFHKTTCIFRRSAHDFLRLASLKCFAFYRCGVSPHSHRKTKWFLCKHSTPLSFYDCLALYEYQKTEYRFQYSVHLHILVIFTFSSSFRFLFTSNAWFLVVLSLTNLLLNTSLCTVSLESA